MSTLKITAVIVTYNRRALLMRSYAAIAEQTCRPDQILIVDNASTDGTREMLATKEWVNRSRTELLALPENTGGAGGFAAGLKHAIENGADWVWMMDDDAEPHLDALEQLMCVAADPDQIYGSLAVCGNETSWLTTVLNPPLGEISCPSEIPESAVVQSLPFLGFLIHRDLVNNIGLPDAGYFIAADDIEYCVRAQKAGAKIILASKSRIEHPKSRPYKVHILGKTLTCLALPPWKRYYDTRNRIFIARKYYGLRLLTQTIPGSFIRLFGALLRESNKLAQAHAFFAGFFDGLLGNKGKRHETWGIKS